MRLLLIRNAFSYDFGGAERFVVLLGEELMRQHGWEIVIVTAHKKIHQLAKERGVKTQRGWWWKAQNWSGFHITLVPVYILWQLVLTAWYLQLIWRVKADIVHPQSKDDFIAATLAAKILGKGILWTDHADLKYIYQNVFSPFKNPVGKLVLLASRFTPAITLVSKSEEHLIEQALGRRLPSRYRVVHNGAYDRTAAPLKRHDKDEGAIIFCATSRLVTAKGIGELIRAFGPISSSHPGKYRLWLIGGGPEEARFKKEADGNPDIMFVGHTNKPLEYLAASDIFVHPSYHEGFSLSVVEAAMLSKPIIACNVGGNPEIITNDKNGLLVPAKDADALAAAMERLASNAALRTKLGVAARQTYAEHFRFDKIIKSEFIPLYEQAAKN